MLGEGGFAKVYVAPLNGEDVAVKMLTEKNTGLFTALSGSNRVRPESSEGKGLGRVPPGDRDTRIFIAPVHRFRVGNRCASFLYHHGALRLWRPTEMALRLLASHGVGFQIENSQRRSSRITISARFE